MALSREEKRQLQRQMQRRSEILLARALASEDAERAALTRALQYLSDEEYGHCLDCGADIPFAQLRAEPTALRCARCQTLCAKNFAHPESHLPA